MAMKLIVLCRQVSVLLSRFSYRVFGWGLGRVGMERTAPIAVWMEMRRVGLAPEGNILLRCGFHSSVKIWRTEPLQPRQRLPSPSPSSPSVVLATPLAAPRQLAAPPISGRLCRPIFFFPDHDGPDRAAPSSSFPATALPSPAARHRISRIAVWRPRDGRRVRQRGALGGRAGGGARGTKKEEERAKIQFGFSCRVPDAKVLERSFCGSSLD